MATNILNDLREMNTEKIHISPVSSSLLHSKKETGKTKLNQILTDSKVDIESKLYKQHLPLGSKLTSETKPKSPSSESKLEDQHLSARSELTPDIQPLLASKELTADIPLSLGNELKPNVQSLLSTSMDSIGEINLPEPKNIQLFDSSNIVEELVNSDNQNSYIENNVKFTSNKESHSSKIGIKNIINTETLWNTCINN